jgi:hypothetical protein
MEPYFAELMMYMQYPELYIEIEQAKQIAQAAQTAQPRQEAATVRPSPLAVRLLNVFRLKTA